MGKPAHGRKFMFVSAISSSPVHRARRT
jgi:hypothetical protein